MLILPMSRDSYLAYLLSLGTGPPVHDVFLIATAVVCRTNSQARFLCARTRVFVYECRLCLY